MNEKHGGLRRTVLCAALLAVLLFAGSTTAHAAQQPRMLVPVGKTFGVKLFSEGVMVVDVPQDAQETGLKSGDVLLRVNDTALTSAEQLRALVQENGAAAMTLSVRRGARLLTLHAQGEADEQGVYRLGAWVRDSMAGIGTMTYYDPQSGAFGALGHGVTDVDTAQLLPLGSGALMAAEVKAVRRGESGTPGELRGSFDLTHESGTLTANTDCGLFGTLEADAATNFGAAIPVAQRSEVHTGAATVLANCAGDAVEEYFVEIERIYNADASPRDLLLRVTDPALLALTGGIVQGMSGSPIIQDGKLVGAVTHVLVNDPTRGYGIFIENMLDAAG